MPEYAPSRYSRDSGFPWYRAAMVYTASDLPPESRSQSITTASSVPREFPALSRSAAAVVGESSRRLHVRILFQQLRMFIGSLLDAIKEDTSSGRASWVSQAAWYSHHDTFRAWSFDATTKTHATILRKMRILATLAVPLCHRVDRKRLVVSQPTVYHDNMRDVFEPRAKLNELLRLVHGLDPLDARPLIRELRAAFHGRPEAGWWHALRADARLCRWRPELFERRAVGLKIRKLVNGMKGPGEDEAR